MKEMCMILVWVFSENERIWKWSQPINKCRNLFSRVRYSWWVWVGGMWGGHHHASSTLAGKFFTTALPGKPYECFTDYYLGVLSMPGIIFFSPVLWFFDLQNSCIINLLIVLTGILGWYVSLYTISWHMGKYLVTKLCLTLLQPHRLDCSLPGKNTGVHYNFLPQDIFPAHRLNPHCRWILYCWATREA